MKTKYLHRLIVFSLFLIIFFCHCFSVKNYKDPEGPKFKGEYGENIEQEMDTITVVSFNIAYGEKIDRAIWEFKNFSNLRRVDIILLQEMDEGGCETLAKTMGYNYVYYPATSRDGKNFGNAILSKWPIKEEQKIILPFTYYIKKTARIAVGATIQLGKHEIRTYNVHTATILLSEEKRIGQVDSMVNNIPQKWQKVIVGGDFNTIGGTSLTAVTQIFSKHGFIHVSENVGSTADFTLLDFALDHIYSKGLKIVDSGKVESSEASDHLPVWARFVLE
jgi:endonuclease/exonuclease/phosphatase family metal-dependent hydrolase